MTNDELKKPCDSQDETALVRAIHAASTQMVLAVTGGGAGAIATLLRTPGGSRTLLDASVPYSAAALDWYLGSPPENYCTQATARAMAGAAFERAMLLAVETLSPEQEEDAPLAGIACTASLASDRPKRGPHRAHVAVQTADYTLAATLELEKGHRDRAGEEDLVARFILQHVALACGAITEVSTAALGLTEAERFTTCRAEAEPDWRDLLTGQLDAVCQGGEDFEEDAEQDTPADANLLVVAGPEEVEAAPGSGVIFPGSFHPRHAGHLGMADVAAKRLGVPVEFELSIENVDKPPLDYLGIAERVQQFAPAECLWLTRAPTFVEKSELFPGATFIVGADTVARIAEPHYYGEEDTLDAIAARDEALEALTERGCRFLVFGRTDFAGHFLSLADLELPPALAAICEGVPESEFREDVSATELRLASGAEEEAKEA